MIDPLSSYPQNNADDHAWSLIKTSLYMHTRTCFCTHVLFLLPPPSPPPLLHSQGVVGATAIGAVGMEGLET